MGENIGGRDLFASPMVAASNISPVPRGLSANATRMQILERDLFWDYFCVHKRFMPAPKGQRSHLINKYCQEYECISIRAELREELARIYAQLPPFGGSGG